HPPQMDRVEVRSDGLPGTRPGPANHFQSLSRIELAESRRNLQASPRAAPDNFHRIDPERVLPAGQSAQQDLLELPGQGLVAVAATEEQVRVRLIGNLLDSIPIADL